MAEQIYSVQYAFHPFEYADDQLRWYLIDCMHKDLALKIVKTISSGSTHTIRIVSEWTKKEHVVGTGPVDYTVWEALTISAILDEEQNDQLG